MSAAPDPSPVVRPARLIDLSGRTAVVAGASSGIGARAAAVLAAAGATVVLGARRAERLEAVARRCRRGVAVPVDLTDAAGRVRLVDTAVERTGRLDVLVNCVGSSTVAPALDVDDTAFTDQLALNVTTAYGLARAAAVAMQATPSGGAIVQVASIYGLVASGSLPQAAYAASKAALVNLTRELAVQWAPLGVRVNALCPGWFPSEMTADMLDDDRGRDWVTRRTPLRRAGRIEELDGPVLFLAGEASTYVTGAVLVVDGGYTSI